MKFETFVNEVKAAVETKMGADVTVATKVKGTKSLLDLLLS